MLSFIYFSLYLESTKKSTSRKVDDGAMVKFIDELYVYQILSIEWYFWLLQCNGNESQYLPNYLSLWNSVYTTWWKLVQKVKRQNKYQKAKTLHLQSYLPMHFPILPTCMYTGARSIRFHDRDETGSQSRDGSGPMNESQTPAPYSSQLAIKRTEDTSLKLIYQK